uniref:Uncharacterized protein n=2 Tax=Cajanus cajan TaxID=3821 RepID=A0A151U7F2_CAJCA|nr:hypothetical protein KK1_007918 [Cajanus cajan]
MWATSRTQAIMRGQRELMEMVKNMPESNYELSLKDLVEHHRVEARLENKVEERGLRRGKGGGGGGSRKVAQVKTKGNIDRGGFYLKMVLPFSLGSKDKKKVKKKSESSGNSSSRVTPRLSDGSAKGGVDNKEWWKKSPAPGRETDSGASSLNSESAESSRSSSSNSSSRSNSRRENSGRRCWPFIRRLKRQTQK